MMAIPWKDILEHDIVCGKACLNSRFEMCHLDNLEYVFPRKEGVSPSTYAVGPLKLWYYLSPSLPCYGKQTLIIIHEVIR